MRAHSRIFSLLNNITGDKGFALVDSLLLLAILIIFIVVLVITFSSFEMPDKSQVSSTSPQNIQAAGTSY
jgi:amino acid permease